MDNENETRFCVIFSTKKLLSFLSKSDVLHLDATYRLVWQGYPVLIVGVTSSTGKFYGSMVVLSSHEDSDAIAEIYKFIHDTQDVHPKFRMGDGATSITKAGREIFGECNECNGAQRLMCWSHVHRALVPQLKPLNSLDKELGKNLLKDIEEIQWSVNDSNINPISSGVQKQREAPGGCQNAPNRLILVD